MNKTYSEEDKKQAVFKVLSGALRKSEVRADYGIRESSSWTDGLSVTATVA